jgi:predicted negative regulator of RcsB-dependent stress response
MQKKQIKQDTKREDAFITSVEKSKNWISHNTRKFALSIGIIIVLVFLSWAYIYYLDSKDSRVQYALSEAIKNYQEYIMNNKPDSLPKAESSFKLVSKDGSKGLRDVAQLYLAKIYIAKGNNAEAKSVYEKLLKSPTNEITKKLAESAIKDFPSTK